MKRICMVCLLDVLMLGCGFGKNFFSSASHDKLESHTGMNRSIEEQEERAYAELLASLRLLQESLNYKLEVPNDFDLEELVDEIIAMNQYEEVSSVNFSKNIQIALNYDRETLNNLKSIIKDLSHDNHKFALELMNNLSVFGDNLINALDRIDSDNFLSMLKESQDVLGLISIKVILDDMLEKGQEMVSLLQGIINNSVLFSDENEIKKSLELIDAFQCASSRVCVLCTEFRIMSFKFVDSVYSLDKRH
ncbi:hypothetical protein bcCo53_001141 (plasmid) [Borrelia coriaceae]|uniref:hypothetical protein n=1 Tax=Borrelia coriaceae TaxID=144 RepID=UPI0012DD041D|nr:hypothetical protein [Borrelia coriaceae]UPA16973.1 hypothetical protein bcCo53_001141 [Borrelia coriaceae]